MSTTPATIKAAPRTIHKLLVSILRKNGALKNTGEQGLACSRRTAFAKNFSAGEFQTGGKLFRRSFADTPPIRRASAASS